MKLPDGRIAKVFHLRIYLHGYPLSVDRWENKEKRPYSQRRHGLVPQTKGGKTVVQILDSHDQEVIVAEGKAYCRPDENYNKQLGREIALGRALLGKEEHDRRSNRKGY